MLRLTENVVKELTPRVANRTTELTATTTELRATLATVSGMVEPTTPVKYEFRNESGVALSLRKLETDGSYSEPFLLLPGQRETITGFSNQLWSTSSTTGDVLKTSGSFHDIGFFQENRFSQEKDIVVFLD